MASEMKDFMYGLIIGAVANVAFSFIAGGAFTNFFGPMIAKNKSRCASYTGAQNQLCMGKCVYWTGAEFQQCMREGWNYGTS